MKKPISSRPRVRIQESISRKREDATMWATSVGRHFAGEAQPAVEPILVSEETASNMLGLSPRTVWGLGDKGVLRVKRVGRRKLYLVDSLKAFAKSGQEVD
jgi:hypothetical protein